MYDTSKTNGQKASKEKEMEAHSSLWALTIQRGKIISLSQFRRHSLFRRTTVLLDKFLTR